MTQEQARQALTPAIASHIFRSRNILYLISHPDGSVVFANPAVSAMLGANVDGDSSLKLWEILPEAQGERLREMFDEETDEVRTCEISFLGPDKDCITLECTIWKFDGNLAIVGEMSGEDSGKLHRELMALNNEMVVKSRELTRQKRELEHARRELQETLDELEESYWHLKKIQEVLPICMECGKVKTSEADWEDVVDYLQRNALFLSHGYCPDCAEAMMEEYGISHEENENAPGAV